MGPYLRIRGGSGIGDNLYTSAIVRKLHKEVPLEVCTSYQDLYPYPVKFSEFSRQNITYLTHYGRRRRDRTNQWEDVQIISGVKAELKLDWTLKNEKWKSLVPFVFINGGRVPMDRKDGVGRDLLPLREGFIKELEKINLKKVYVGGPRKYDFPIDVDLQGKTSVSDLVDLAFLSEMGFGQVGFIVPLFESLDKKLTCVWSRKGLTSDCWVTRTITPSKILTKPTSKAVFDC